MRRALLAALAAATLVVVPVGPTYAADPVPGGAGIDTSLPATDSQATVAGRGRFSDLRVTVNQTKDLVNQAISVTWTGGTPTIRGNNADFNQDYLQIFQCWGDDDGAVADNPGPPPEQCQQGAAFGDPGRPSEPFFPSGSLAPERVISRVGRPNFDPALGELDTRSGYVWKPFRPVDGPSVGVHFDPTFTPTTGGNYWLNPYFNAITTNEIPGAKTAPNGTGAELFEATTGLESSGLGCGQEVQTQADGSTKVPRCWLVVVPRGSGADENVDSGVEGDRGVATSPLAPLAWQNRIAIELGFNSIKTSCPISAEQRRLVGSELLAGAAASWQPALCATPGLPPFAFGALSDSRARDQLLSGVPGAPGLAVTSRPLDPATINPANPAVYAPLSLSGTVIGFNIERTPKPGSPPEEEPLRGLRVAQLNLTPRIVAKLLTQSYRNQVEITGSPPPYTWSPSNPKHVGLDPDFLRFNPEFNLLETAGGKNIGGLLLAGPGSDAALQVWEWVLSDPEAKAWLEGGQDDWGMKVNPVFATTAGANSTGSAFASPLPDSYPKSDPHCFVAPPLVSGVVPPPLCALDWLPYTQSLTEAARRTRIANDGAKTTTESSALSPEKVYKADGPQRLGSRAIMSVTDAASAAQYGLQTARLSRSGDNGPDRSFVAPDAAGFLAGAQAMKPQAVPEVREPSPGDTPPGAYPLTALTYGAVAPLGLDDLARKEYAAFIDYAAGPGQEAGRKLGQLPPGYAPLPAELRAQGVTAAKTIRELKPAPEAVDPTATGDQEAGGSDSSGSDSDSDSGQAGDDGGSETSADPDGSGGARAAPPAGAPPGPSASGGSSPLATIAKVLATPFEGLARSRFLLPALVVVAMLAALGALEITKRPRRAAARAGTGTELLPIVPPEDSGTMTADLPGPPSPTDDPADTLVSKSVER